MRWAVRIWVGLLIVFVAAVCLVFYSQVRHWENSPTARTTWRNGAPPNEIHVKVIDRAGYPVAGARVDVSDSSSGSGRDTDGEGTAVLFSGEPEVNAVSVNGRRVVYRPFASELGTPARNASGGLVFEVRLRE